MSNWWTRKQKKEEVEKILNETGKVLSDKEIEIVKGVLKKAREELPRLKRSVIDGVTDKKEIIDTLMSFSDAMDIENEETGEMMNRTDFEKMSLSELTTTFEGALEYLEKNI